MKIDCKLVEKTSKDGNPYVCIEIQLTPTYKKLVFLTQAEKELIQLSYNKGSN